jgi:parallel beta-helix repeat protein
MGLHVVILDIGRLQIMNIRVHVKGVVCLICGLALLGSLVHAQRSEANTYYVASDGNDSNPGTEARPFRTLGAGAWALSPGDTLYVKDGTYTGSLAFFGIPSGTSNNPVTIAAYPGHSPVIKTDSGNHALYISYTSYMVIDGLSIDGTNSNTGAGIKITDGASHIKIQNSEITNAFNGIEVNDGSGGNEFLNLQVHHNRAYGVYIASSSNTVEGCWIHDNMGYGIHTYNGSGGVNNNIIIGNTIENNGKSSLGTGILFSYGAGNKAIDNTISGNKGGIDIDYGASNSYISGNTIYGNDYYDIYIGEGGSNTFIGANNVSGNIINYGVSTQILP